MDWAIGLLVKPFIAFAFLVLILLIKELVWRVLPESKFKRVLFSPLRRHR